MNPETDDDDVSAAVSAYDDPKRSMAERVGLRGYAPPVPEQMSKDEADQYLAEYRAKSSGTTAPSDMTKDQADKYLQQYRAQRGTAQAPASFNERFAGDTPTSPATAQQPATKEDYPQGVGLTTLFHNLPPSLQQTIKDHPYIAGAVAAGAIPLAALIPEGAAAAAGGLALRHLVMPGIRAAATAAGGGAAFDYFTGGHIMPKLIDMIGRLGEEGQ